MKDTTKRITLSALFIALGLVLPLLTGQLQQLGNAFLPMHIPVLLCGLIVGPVHGFIVGLILPLLRHFTFHMPPLYPTAISMAFELATYGLVIGLIYNLLGKKNIVAVYVSLIVAMIAGRIVMGIANVILLGINGKAYTFEAFLAGAFLTAIPGIIIQLTLIPAIMIALHRAGYYKFESQNYLGNDGEKTKLGKIIALILLLISILVVVISVMGAKNKNANKTNNKSEVKNMSVKIKYMGQGTARIITEDNKVIYIDPYAGDDYSMAADLILQTHDHFDHSQLDLVSNRNQGCQIITEKEALVNGEHKTFDLPFVKVISVEAGYNKNHDVNKCVGYVLEFKNGKKVYFSGDTSTTKQMSEMASMNIDYAFYCTDGKYNMDSAEAAECAKLVNAKHNIPYHNDPGDGPHFSRKLAEEWTAPNKMIVDLNEEIVLE